MDTIQQVMTPAEVAAAFRVNPVTVTRWAKDGKLNFFRTIGGHRRYKSQDVLAFLGGAQPGGLYLTSEVASKFGVDPNTVTRWAKAGKLAHVTTPGGHRRYAVSVVDSAADNWRRD